MSRALFLWFGGYALEIPAGASLSWSGDGERLTLMSEVNSPITFGSVPIDGGKIDIGLAPGAKSGRISFSGALPGDLLDASIRYFYPDAGNDPPIAGLRYPLFPGQNAQHLRVKVTFDPNRPFDPQASFLTVQDEPAYPSNFRTTVGRPLSIAPIAGESRIVSQWDPVAKSAYTALDGKWTLTNPSGPTGSANVMCGLSGLEYAKVADVVSVDFVAGAPAYAPGFLAAEQAVAQASSLTAQCPASEYEVTTPWIYYYADGPQGGSSIEGYYSQPQNGGLFQTNQRDPNDPFLGVLQIQAAAFPADAKPVFGAPRPSFPVAPYGGVDASTPGPESYRSFEVEILSPTRSNAIYEMNWPGGPQGLASPCAGMTGGSGPTGPKAVTPQGMLATFSADYSIWSWLVLAQAAGDQKLQLGCLCQQLRAALLTNQLFLVISNAAAFKACCEVIDFPTLRMAEWGFDLAPDRWRKDSVLILKFAEKNLEDMVADTSLWSAPNSGFNDGVATQKVLQAWIDEAKDNANQPEFDYFLNTVLKDWNGIIFANCAVPAGDFPPQLIGIAAGIDMEQFAAHHFGVNLSPVSIQGQTIRIDDSSLFGLIFYNDPFDLVYSGTPYDYKVLSLRVLFANSDITSFASTIELLVGELFGERSSLKESLHGDNIILNGVWQRHGSEDSYTFSQVDADTFTVESKVLQNVLINQAQFITLDPEGSTTTQVKTRFILGGSIRFYKLDEFDLFSFGSEGPAGDSGGLRFSSLFISMEFDSSIPNPDRIFAFDAGQSVFDLSSSTARRQSLYARFPLRANALLQGNESTKPADLGFIPLITPLVGGSLGSTWYGIELALNFGSKGSLAAKAGFTASLLAAWAPSKGAYNVAAGLRLPGSEGGKKSLTIQGPLKLTIADLGLLFNEQEQGYILRMNNVLLNFLGVKFPPGGRTNLLLFGDPDPTASNTTLGWYAAYKKDKKKEEKKDQKSVAQRGQPRLPAGKDS